MKTKANKREKMKHGGQAEEEEEEEEAMDWYSWLSKSCLDPSHVYEYGLAFTRNELREEDLRYFNHEFLQSMGISVAKHRLEILKLARKEGSRGLSRFVAAVNRTKKLLAKLVPHPHHQRNVKEVSGALIRQERGVVRPCKSLLMNSSGPLDGKVRERMAMTNRALSVSRPLDGKVQERMMLPSCSPLAWGGKVKERMVFPTISPSKSGPLDAWALMSPNTTHHKGDHHSLWSLMFQDMKPT